MTEGTGRPRPASTSRPGSEGTGRPEPEAGFGPGAGIGKPHAPAPEPLPATAFDSHCHLDMIDLPVAEVLAQARAAGITGVLTVGCDIPSSRWSADCAAAFRSEEHTSELQSP